MEQVKKIVETACRGIAKDSDSLSEMATRECKEIYLVSDADCPTYNFLMILSSRNLKKNNYKKSFDLTADITIKNITYFNSTIKDFEIYFYNDSFFIPVFLKYHVL